MCAFIPKCHWLDEVGVDFLEQRLGEVVVQQQAPELEQRGGIGHRFARQVDAHEVAQCLAVVQGIFQRLVCQAVASARNFSRRVRFFFNAYSALAKLRWFMSVALEI